MIGFEVAVGNKIFRLPTQNSEAWVTVMYWDGRATVNAARIPIPSKRIETWLNSECVELNQILKVRYGELDGEATPPAEMCVKENLPERRSHSISRLERFRAFEKSLREDGILSEND